jgi:hypothetical protein
MLKNLFKRNIQKTVVEPINETVIRKLDYVYRIYISIDLYNH